MSGMPCGVEYCGVEYCGVEYCGVEYCDAAPRGQLCRDRRVPCGLLSLAYLAYPAYPCMIVA